jgi:cholesterol transport system auxiliary component
MTRLDRRFVLLASPSLLLLGCGDLIGPPPPSQIYVLHPAPPPGGVGKVAWALAIAKADASDSLDSERIALSKSDTQFDYYANAVWPDRLPSLVQTALLAGFEASGGIEAVAREEDSLHADYELFTDIRDFEARYASPDGTPSVAVTLIAHMVEAHSRKIAASLTASFTQSASVNSVDAVVEAFDAVLGKAIAQIVTWALALPPPAPP